MSKEEIKQEIGKVLDNFSDRALGELLAFLKELDLMLIKENILQLLVVMEVEKVHF